MHIKVITDQLYQSSSPKIYTLKLNIFMQPERHFKSSFNLKGSHFFQINSGSKCSSKLLPYSSLRQIIFHRCLMVIHKQIPSNLKYSKYRNLYLITRQNFSCQLLNYLVC